MAASVRMRLSAHMDNSEAAAVAAAGRRQSMRALRLEQIAIWGAAAHAESRGADAAPFAERRASLWERDTRSSGLRRTRDRAARRSLVLLDGDRPHRAAPPPVDEDAPARPVVVREPLEDDDDSALSDSSVDSDEQDTGPAGQAATKERRSLFALRAKSAVRPGAAPAFDENAHARARSFFEERRAPGSERSAFARARASIRFLGRYSRSGSARIPLFRPRSHNTNAHAR